MKSEPLQLSVGIRDWHIVNYSVSQPSGGFAELYLTSNRPECHLFH